jgi:hypothetical protein
MQFPQCTYAKCACNFAGLVSKLHFKMTMMAVDETSDLMADVADVAYHLSVHNCRGVVTSLLHLGKRRWCSRKPAKRFEMLTLIYRASQQRPPSRNGGQDLFLLSEYGTYKVRAAGPGAPATSGYRGVICAEVNPL